MSGAAASWRRTSMKSVYRVLAYLIAVGVVVQAMAIVFAIDGLSKWIDGGGQLDKAVDLGVERPFPEVAGLDVHAVNGSIIIPTVALLLLISSFFARVPGGVKWAGVVLLLVVVQVALGISGSAVPALGALHGLNALLLFLAAIYAGYRVGHTAAASATQPDERLATPV
jgi:heme A synthase